jgi:hypothetical protein
MRQHVLPRTVHPIGISLSYLIAILPQAKCFRQSRAQKTNWNRIVPVGGATCTSHRSNLPLARDAGLEDASRALLSEYQECLEECVNGAGATLDTQIITSGSASGIRRQNVNIRSRTN